MAKLATPKKALKRPALRRRFVNLGIVGANALLIGVVSAVVLIHPGQGNATSQVNNYSVAVSSRMVPQDELASLSIAHTAASMIGDDELSSITNDANTAWAELQESALTSTTLSDKPQIVATAYRSYRNIQTYKVKAGDTLASIARHFNVSEDSIRWSNGLDGYSVSVGKTLRIPPVDGIVYKVKKGDTVASLAKKYNISAVKLASINDAEVNGLKPGSYIMLPGATKRQDPVFFFLPTYTGGNSYQAGQCTWYVANRVDVPNGWGNANSWDYYAEHTPGWTVTSRPVVGAVAQDNKGAFGHVAVVDAVSADGTMIKYSDMNHYWIPFQVNHFGWVPASTFDNYIYQ